MMQVQNNKQFFGVTEAPIPRAAIIVQYDASARLLRLHSRGFLEPKAIDKCFLDAARIIGTMRTAGIPVRALIDAREATIQSAESADRIKIGTRQLYGPGDRVAMLVINSLVKLQLRRVVDERTHELFMSESAAMTWLFAGH
jgi:hypothetical protein